MTEEMRKLKQKSGVRGPLIHVSYLSILGEHTLVLEEGAKHCPATQIEATPSWCYSGSLIPLRPLSPKHIKNLYFQNKHDTISVNRENLT